MFQTYVIDISPEADICLICHDDIHTHEKYAIIDSDGERAYKYHVSCLEAWFAKNKRGIITDKEIERYHVYSGDNIVRTVDMKSPYMADIPDNIVIHISDDNPNRYYQIPNNRCRGYVVGTVFLIVIAIIIYLSAK